MKDALALQLDMLEAVRARDFDGLRALYHPDYVYMSADGVEQKGADAGVAVAELYLRAFPDMAFEIRHQFAAGPNASIIELTARGTHQDQIDGIPATGRAVEVVVCNVVEAQDGLIVREREYFDGLSIMRQLGIIED
ncbi:MAG: ester cyclase [Actinomycetota bacterium]